MTMVEKFLVNRRSKGAANVDRIRRQVDHLGLSTSAAVLEIGCGTGDVTAYLARTRGCRAVGVDIDEGQVRVARQRHGEDPQLRYLTADATQRLPFSEASFDVVVSQNAFHHMPAWRGAVWEITRVLKPGGTLLWLDLTPPAFLARALGKLDLRYGVYSVADVRATFVAAGLMEVAARALSGGWRHELVVQRG